MNVPTGTMYDGLGKRLKGDGRGPESALGLLGRIAHKTLLHEGSAGGQPVEMIETDRFYLVPDALKHTKRLPFSWMVELALVLADGGRVGILSHRAKSLAIVVEFLRKPDAVLASGRKETMADEMHEQETRTQRVGLLCDGTGKYLDGDNDKAVAWQADETQQFRGFLNGSKDAAARTGLLVTDRLYIMPADYLTVGALPLWIMAKLMITLKQGGKVLIIAPNRDAFDRLLEIVSEPEKLFLAIEPAAGRA